MKVELTSDAAEFRDLVFDALRADPVLNTIMLSAVAARSGGDIADPRPPTYARLLDDDGGLVATAMRTPPHNILLSPLMTPAQALLVADAIAGECADAIGAHGSAETIAAFVGRWRELTGTEAAVDKLVRLHRLGRLSMPDAAGTARVASMDDVPLAREWYGTAAGILGEPMADDQAEQVVVRQIGEGTLWFWYDGDRPVSLVGYRLPQYGVSRVGPVYTPAEYRGNGYASALTAHVSRQIRAAGADACLFTDLANPTSNKIYAAIGYQPVADFVQYRFTS
jgi:predicted GNAT family acetyltransferase